jgi:excisionase family DNA binding protein
MENIQTVNVSSPSVEVAGIDELFDVTDATVTAVPAGDKLEVTVTEAARLLDISKRTIWRRIRDGELASRSNGRETFVAIPASLEIKMAQDRSKSDKAKAPHTAQVTDTEVTAIKTELERTKSELMAVTCRAQYLQGQVDLYEQHFKLLVDSQHKAGWWARFRTWASGVR